MLLIKYIFIGLADQFSLHSAFLLEIVDTHRAKKMKKLGIHNLVKFTKHNGMI
jgi:hypothetical protein